MGKLLLVRKKITDAFNRYFVNIGPSLSGNLTETSSRFQDFLKEKNINSFLLKDTQPAFTCSKLSVKTLEQGVKYV